MSATVKDVMSTHVVAVRKFASYKEIAARLHELRVSAFPVIDDDNKVIGVVSEADLLTKEALEGDVPSALRSMVHQNERSKVTAVTAADLMTRPPVTIGPDEPVTHAARLMYSQRVKRLPVTSEDGTLIGIVTRSDVLSVYGRPDAEIRREITEDLILGKFLCDPARFTVTVKDGIVTIQGAPETAPVGRASSTRPGTLRASSPSATGSPTRPTRRPTRAHCSDRPATPLPGHPPGPG